MKVFRVHNVNFYRIGACKRCGECEKTSCPHFSMKDGLATCDTYGCGDYLERHCDAFPADPFCRVVRKGICGFKFTPVTDEDAIKYEELLVKWQLLT